MRRLEPLHREILKRGFAFSLVELMISLITISCIAAAFTPVITKKLKKQDVALSLAQTSEIISPCIKDASGTKFIQGGDDNSDCQLCTMAKCIKCQKECGNGTYLDSNACECISCDKFKGEGENGTCLTCTKNGCTECKSEPVPGFKIDEQGFCKACPSSRYESNGKDKCAVICDENKVGIYCKDNKEIPCDNIVSSCSDCKTIAGKPTCTKCGNYSYLENNECKGCGLSYCYACKKINNQVSCLGCQSDSIMQNQNGINICIGCEGMGLSHCNSCNNNNGLPVCDNCVPGYYLKNGSCLNCSSISNCTHCDNNGVCTNCIKGYFPSNNICAKCNSTNCALCNSAESSGNTCALCKKGYYLTDGVCKANDSNFRCSDDYFVRIGNLCVMRKNFGDGPLYKIPSGTGIIKLEADDGVYCPTSTSKCCWGGYTAMTGWCNSDATTYDGCTRTLCNGLAAKDLCANFNYAGKKWRLPTSGDSKNWSLYSRNLGEDGLDLCHVEEDDSSQNRCHWSGKCKGARYDRCECESIKRSNEEDSYYAHAVRCVTEMD